MIAGYIIAIILLLALSGFFSGSETALTAASRARMHQLEKDGDKRATAVNRLIANREGQYEWAIFTLNTNELMRQYEARFPLLQMETVAQEAKRTGQGAAVLGLILGLIGAFSLNLPVTAQQPADLFGGSTAGPADLYPGFPPAAADRP